MTPDANCSPITLSCKLTTPELQARKATIIGDLRQRVLEKKELQDGFTFRFDGDDATLNMLMQFVQTERRCCSFFRFGLSIQDDASSTWLNLTGPEGAKQFITLELGL